MAKKTILQITNLENLESDARDLDYKSPLKTTRSQLLCFP